MSIRWCVVFSRITGAHALRETLGGSPAAMERRGICKLMIYYVYEEILDTPEGKLLTLGALSRLLGMRTCNVAHLPYGMCSIRDGEFSDDPPAHLPLDIDYRP